MQCGCYTDKFSTYLTKFLCTTWLNFGKDLDFEPFFQHFFFLKGWFNDSSPKYHNRLVNSHYHCNVQHLLRVWKLWWRVPLLVAIRYRIDVRTIFTNWSHDHYHSCYNWGCWNCFLLWEVGKSWWRTKKNGKNHAKNSGFDFAYSNFLFFFFFRILKNWKCIYFSGFCIISCWYPGWIWPKYDSIYYFHNHQQCFGRNDILFPLFSQWKNETETYVCQK